MKYSKEDIVNGQIILIDKPLHWSSFQAVNKIKWAIKKSLGLKKIKVGHAGTLDPLATGLLIICTGKATKEISKLQAEVKEYTGTITLGASRPSYDLETEIDHHYPTKHITPEAIATVTKSFIGKILQQPPVFSALKKDGKRLYEYAREGEEIDIPSREIEIFEFNTDPSGFPDITFRVVCSKGTYIRSLAHDFGKSLDSGAYLSALRRTKSGDFNVDNAIAPTMFQELLISTDT